MYKEILFNEYLKYRKNSIKNKESILELIFNLTNKFDVLNNTIFDIHKSYITLKWRNSRLEIYEYYYFHILNDNYYLVDNQFISVICDQIDGLFNFVDREIINNV